MDLGPLSGWLAIGQTDPHTESTGADHTAPTRGERRKHPVRRSRTVDMLRPLPDVRLEGNGEERCLRFREFLTMPPTLTRAISMIASAFSDDVSAWSTLALALLTVALGYFGFRQIRLTRSALALAAGDTQEAIRNRIDQRAPLVVLILDHEEDPTNYPEAFHIGQIRPTECRPGDAVVGIDDQIAWSGWFWMQNEGRTTGVVWVSGRVFDAGAIRDPRPPLSSIKYAQPSSAWSFRLTPGQGRLLYIYQGRSVHEWQGIVSSGETSSNTFLLERVAIEDTLEGGIRDTTEIRFFGIPVRRAPTETWVINRDLFCRIEIGSIDRTYRALRPDEPTGRKLTSKPLVATIFTDTSQFPPALMSLRSTEPRRIRTKSVLADLASELFPSTLCRTTSSRCIDEVIGECGARVAVSRDPAEARAVALGST